MKTIMIIIYGSHNSICIGTLHAIVDMSSKQTKSTDKGTYTNL